MERKFEKKQLAYLRSQIKTSEYAWTGHKVRGCADDQHCLFLILFYIRIFKASEACALKTV